MNIIQDTNEFFVKAVRNPAEKREVQMGVHFEEICEMLDTIKATSTRGRRAIQNAKARMHELAEYAKNDPKGMVYVADEDRSLFLDSLCDQIVTATGCGYMHDMNIPDALAEVNRSNFSKFDESGQPIFLPNGKIGKSDRYSPPNLIPFVGG